MSNRQAVIAAIHASVEHYINMANEKLDLSLEKPEVRFNVRGTCGGKAHGSQWYVDFNMGLIVDNMSEYLNQVVPHEIAHLVVHAVHGVEYKRTRRGLQRVSHGKNFYRVMRMFGVEETRTHNMDTSKVRNTRRTTKYVYACTCGAEVKLGAIRHKKTGFDGVAPYRHKCHTIGKLTFTGKAIKS